MKARVLSVIKKVATITFVILTLLIAGAVILPFYWNAYYKEKIEHVVGPMRTDKEWGELAEAGDQAAQSEQCSMHGFRKDVEADFYRKIVTWCFGDAEKGSVASEYLLAKLYESGEGGLPQSWENAYFWYAVRITDDHISTVELNEVKKHLLDQQIKATNEKVTNWKTTLCASKPTERNAAVMREWHCGPAK